MTFEPAISHSHLALLAVAALAVTLAAAWISRRRFSLAATAVRLAIFALVLLVLANPVERGELALPGPAAWQAVLLDTSASMSLGGDHPRWREGLDWLAPLLENDASARLATFDSATNFTAQPPSEARGAASQLGQAIERVLEQAGDSPPAQIVVVSDGIFDDAPQIAAAVAKARARQVVVSTHLVGRDESVPNLAFKRFRAPRFAAAESRVIVSYEVASSGLPPATPLAVTIRGEDGRVVAEDSWTLRENTGPREVPVALTLRAERFTASLRVVDGEVTDADNALAFRIELTDPKIRVFYAEGSQTTHQVGSETWAAGRIMPTAFRRAGDIECEEFAMEQQNGRGQPLYYVRGFDERERGVLDRGHGIPTDRAGWERYDVIIISDIDRQTFSAKQMEWIRQCVSERGGGFAMFGGTLSFDTGNYDQTIWEKLIPVDCLQFGFGHAWRPTQPQFTAAQGRHPILHLVADEATNNAIFACHPAFRGYHDIGRVKPGAVALAKVEGTEAPIIAVQEYGRGRTMAFLSDPAGGWGQEYQGVWGPALLAEQAAEAVPGERALIEDPSLA
ncbi:MAG: glutamine amidotransferase, partial [Chthoniobacteraceae bacterium]